MNNQQVLLVDSGSLWLIAGFVVLVIGIGIAGVRLRINRANRDNVEQLTALRREVQGLRPDEGTPTQEELRTEALKEALRREPELADTSDPESAQRLSKLVHEVSEELALRAEVERLRQQEEREAEALAQRRAAEKAAEQARIRFEEEQEAKRQRDAEARRKREASLAAMGPTRRWLATHKAVSLTLVGVMAVAIGVIASVFINQENQRRQAADAAAQEQAQAEASAAARAQLEAACDLSQVSQLASDSQIMNAWASCSDATVRNQVAQSASLGSLESSVMQQLASDESSDVRASIAARSDVSPDLQAALATDASESVRITVARNTSASADFLAALLADDAKQVRIAAAQNPTTPLDALEQYADARDEEFRKAVWFRIYDDPCEPGVPPDQSLAGTTWVWISSGDKYYYRLDKNCGVAYSGAGEKAVFNYGDSEWSWNGVSLVVSINDGFWKDSFEFKGGKFVSASRTLERVSN